KQSTHPAADQERSYHPQVERRYHNESSALRERSRGTATTLASRYARSKAPNPGSYFASTRCSDVLTTPSSIARENHLLASNPPTNATFAASNDNRFAHATANCTSS